MWGQQQPHLLLDALVSSPQGEYRCLEQPPHPRRACVRSVPKRARAGQDAIHDGPRNVAAVWGAARKRRYELVCRIVVSDRGKDHAREARGHPRAETLSSLVTCSLRTCPTERRRVRSSAALRRRRRRRNAPRTRSRCSSCAPRTRASTWMWRSCARMCEGVCFRSAAAGVTTPAGCAGGAAAQDIKNTKADGDHCGAPRVAPCAPGAAAAHEAGAYSTRALRCNPFTLTRTCARAFGPGQVRTASGIAVVAVMCKPHRCPHIATTGNVCVYCPGGPDSDFEYSTQSYTGCVRARDAGASGAADGHAAYK